MGAVETPGREAGPGCLPEGGGWLSSAMPAHAGLPRYFAYINHFGYCFILLNILVLNNIKKNYPVPFPIPVVVNFPHLSTEKFLNYINVYFTPYFKSIHLSKFPENFLPYVRVYAYYNYGRSGNNFCKFVI